MSRAAVAGDERAVTPTVGKVLEAGLVVLYVSLLTAALFGGVIPDYRAATGAEVGERVLSQAAARVEAAIPPSAVSATVVARVDLPRTVAGDGYRVRARDRALVLEHPDPLVGGRATLALPGGVREVTGTWSSRERAVVRVRRRGDAVAVELVAGGDASAAGRAAPDGPVQGRRRPSGAAQDRSDGPTPGQAATNPEVPA